MAPTESLGAILVSESGAPGRTRTCNPWVRSPVLYPLSYRRIYRGNRVLLLGRATGFEPVISCATDRRLRPLGYARHAGSAVLKRVGPSRTQLLSGLNMLANERGCYKESQLAPAHRPNRKSIAPIMHSIELVTSRYLK